MRPSIIRITRKTRAWFDPTLHFQIEIFVPVATKHWEKKALAIWSGATAQQAVTAFRKRRC